MWIYFKSYDVCLYQKNHSKTPTSSASLSLRWDARDGLEMGWNDMDAAAWGSPSFGLKLDLNPVCICRSML